MMNDDSEIWYQTQGQEIQDFETPPDPAADFAGDVSASLNPDFYATADEAEPEQVTQADVRQRMNLQAINKPFANLIVGGIDAIVPLVFVAIVKGTDTGDLKLDPNEREELENAFALYLGEKSVNVSPGYALLFTIACIYGSKIYTALQNRKQNELIEAQRKQIEELKQQNAALQSMLARENEETDEQ